jgi:hypothetical protein
MTKPNTIINKRSNLRRKPVLKAQYKNKITSSSIDQKECRSIIDSIANHIHSLSVAYDQRPPLMLHLAIAAIFEMGVNSAPDFKSFMELFLESFTDLSEDYREMLKNFADKHGVNND